MVTGSFHHNLCFSGSEKPTPAISGDEARPKYAKGFILTEF